MDRDNLNIQTNIKTQITTKSANDPSTPHPKPMIQKPMKNKQNQPTMA